MAMEEYHNFLSDHSLARGKSAAVRKLAATRTTRHLGEGTWRRRGVLLATVRHRECTDWPPAGILQNDCVGIAPQRDKKNEQLNYMYATLGIEQGDSSDDDFVLEEDEGPEAEDENKDHGPITGMAPFDSAFVSFACNLLTFI
ncbi:unnamed protein product [Phytophthora fragariaefolia]|uniref:Unnamed protein product n=1 Tax=Phytophthora fragariaefolia TaxID=1490495 RepID=A0A9W6TY62_9STRA|nr:unnamed protein product [Phytophthora fragariaefolia]